MDDDRRSSSSAPDSSEAPFAASSSNASLSSSDAHRQSGRKRRRRLRAVLAADVAGFSGRVSVDETGAFTSVSSIRHIAEDCLAKHDGWLFGMPGDGVFALFESSVDALNCALDMQAGLCADRDVGDMKMRIGLHCGEVLFENDIPFGETLAIAARLEALADPGGILVSSTLADTASARVKATFEPAGVPKLKNIPRRIRTFKVSTAPASDLGAEALDAQDDLDRTMHVRRTLADLLPQDTVDALAGALSLAIGPIASVVVERQLQKATSLERLVDSLAADIPVESDRDAFRARCADLSER